MREPRRGVAIQKKRTKTTKINYMGTILLDGHAIKLLAMTSMEVNNYQKI